MLLRTSVGTSIRKLAIVHWPRVAPAEKRGVVEDRPRIRVDLAFVLLSLKFACQTRIVAPWTVSVRIRLSIVVPYDVSIPA